MIRKFLIIQFLFLVYLTTLSGALASDSCSSYLANDWDDAEKWAWERICSGTTADFSKAAKVSGTINCFNFSLDEKPSLKSNEIRGKFLSDILNATRIKKIADNVKKISIKCANVKGPINLGHREIDSSLHLTDSTIIDKAIFTSTTIKGDLDFSWTRFRQLDVNKLTIFGDFVLTRSRGDHLSAVNLTINKGSLIADSAKLTNADLSGAIISDSIFFDRIIENDYISLERCRIGQSIFMRMGEFGSINGIDSKLGGSLVLCGSSVSRELNLIKANMDGLVLSQTGLAHWGDVVETPIKWSTSSSFILRNAIVRSILDSPQAWNNLSNRVDFVGLQFDNWSGSQSCGAPIGSGFARGDTFADEEYSNNSIINKDVATLLSLIRSQSGSKDTYIPQPYKIFSQHLRKVGLDKNAEQIEYARIQYKMMHTQTAPLTRAFLYVVDSITGFGHKLHRALLYFMSLVIVGILLLGLNKTLVNLSFSERLFLSLEKSIPFVKFGIVGDLDASNWPSWLKGYLFIHVLLGYLLASVLLSALTVKIGIF